jgi:hypothetical protein
VEIRNPLDWRTASDEELLSLRPEEILALRYSHPNNVLAQNRLAPIDHQTFTREAVGQEGPLTAAGLGLVAPAYQVKKMLTKGDQFTSEPSIEQLRREYLGMGLGLKDWYMNKANRLGDIIEHLYK